jgi:adenylate cyclase
MSDPTSGSFNTPRRRAVLFADLVESVRLYEKFEARTIDQWRRFADLAREQIAPAHGGGRLVRTVGDGLLLEFETAGAASTAAFALHSALARFNGPDVGEQIEQGAMWLRIGLHLADVVADSHDLWGNGVNLAARLSTLAQPGQTIASAELRCALDDAVHADIEDLGLRYLKHITEPVRAFVLRPPGSTGAATPRSPSTEDLRPAVAVVPFVALPADPEHDALGHAMADDIIASLSRHPGLRVLSRASTAAVRGANLELPRLRELLGASFLLTGQFYVRGKRVRLAAELCELRGGQVLWAGGVGGDVDAVFEGQDELVPHLVAQVSQQVLAHELARVRSLPMSSLASYSLLLGAQGLLNSLSPPDFASAREALGHLADRHPRQAAPHAMMATWYAYRVLQGWTESPAQDVQRSSESADAALQRDPTSTDALIARGLAHVFVRRDFSEAERDYRQALSHDPHCAAAWARLSECQSQAGELAEAVRSALHAIALSPLDPQRFLYESYAARAAFVRKDYPHAIELARASVRRNAMHSPAHRLLIASLWLDGQLELARRAAGDLVRLLPGARAGDGPSATSLARARTPFVQALLDAGVPE